MQNPIEMQRGVMALHHQAYRMLSKYKSELEARSLGFSAEDKAAIEASHAANPVPQGYSETTVSTADQQAEIEAVRQAALNAVYPPEGISEDDPRLTPISGIDLITYATIAGAIGWSPDTALKNRVCKALGVDPAAYDSAGGGWTQRLRADVVLSTLYGQLLAAASGAPEQNF